MRAAYLIVSCFRRGSKLLVCGNGGSAADAQHFVAEFVGRFKDEGRPALPAIAPKADSAVLTAWSNDVAYDSVFAREVEALGRRGDVLVGISTSDRSANVVRAFRIARQLGLRRLALTGGDGGELRELADVTRLAPSTDTQRVQEVQTLVLHLLCELVESLLLRGTALGALERGRFPQPSRWRRGASGPPPEPHQAYSRRPEG